MGDQGDEMAWRATLDRVLAEQPLVHPDATNGMAWRTNRSCYEFLGASATAGSRTLETGAGVSTVLFAAWGCRHTSVVPSPDEAGALLAYCAERGIDTTSLTFDLRPSEVALPDMRDSEPFDVVFIDGAHSFPLPTIDWFYGAGLLRKGGVVVFDDALQPAVATLLESFVDPDPRWERVGGATKWRAYRRLSEGPLAEHESRQPFYVGTPPSGWARLTRQAKEVLPLGVRQSLDRLVRHRS